MDIYNIVNKEEVSQNIACLKAAHPDQIIEASFFTWQEQKNSPSLKGKALITQRADIQE